MNSARQVFQVFHQQVVLNRKHNSSQHASDQYNSDHDHNLS